MPIKLLIVDDSALMRRQLTQLFEAAGDFVLRQARNGQEAVAENLAFEPDVITLDINMPQMDGLTALAYLMAQRPVPVVMVSSLTEKGALATFEAMALGAVDYVAKPDGTISLSIDQIKDALIEKVRAAAQARLKHGRAASAYRAPRAPKPPPPAKPSFVRRAPSAREGLVLIGVSTGGPSTLEDILPRLPADFPFPILIAQHMPAAFTGPFAARMDAQCALNVVEANAPMRIEPGRIYIGKGGTDLSVVVRAGQLMALPRPESSAHLWHPSVDVLGRSVLEHCEADHVIGVLLTGMGYDGAAAFAELKRQGGRTIAESADTAVVFGMPRELIAKDGASVVLPAPDIAAQLQRWASD